MRRELVVAAHEPNAKPETKETLCQCEVLGDLVADRRVTASAVVCLTTNEQILTIRDDIFGATSTVHALRSAVPHDQNPEDLRLQKTLPEAAHLLLAGD